MFFQIVLVLIIIAVLFRPVRRWFSRGLGLALGALLLFMVVAMAVAQYQ